MPDDAAPRPADATQAGRTATPEPRAGASLVSDGDTPFDETAYVAAFPDVAEAIRRGELSSALDHYRIAGRLEQRLQRQEYRRQLGRPAAESGAKASRRMHPEGPAVSLEAVAMSQSGALFIAGWADDRHTSLTTVAAQIGRGMRWAWSGVPRVRRQDVEAVLPTPRPYQYGFWLFGQIEADAALRGPMVCETVLKFADGSTVDLRRVPTLCSDAELRDLAMTYLANASYCGNRVAEVFANLDMGVGDALIGFNRAISQEIVAGATVARFGPQRSRYRASLIVPLYGIGDYLFVQSCAYAQSHDMAEHEFIYVINSPELAEKLHRESRIAEMIYGLPVSLVTLPDNAGFGMANNIGARFARSDRILCVNPDVFPRDPGWTRRHADLLASLPAEQTRLFGTSLFYDDGSLMHGGMYFDLDSGILTGAGRVAQRQILRVEHYGKGAPAWARQFVESRPVPAVTGAFMSFDRAWFESLGGFTEDYIFGHYEDADLCLKSWQAGTPVWLHDVPMWHLEGKGSRRLPQHEGGSLLNRWLFTRTWAPLVVPDMIGRTPRLEAFPAEPPAEEAPRPVPRAAAAGRGARMRSA